VWAFLKGQKISQIISISKLEMALATWFNQACSSKAEVSGPHLKEKTLAISSRLAADNFTASNGWMDIFKRL
jgi:hypothetical protein